MTSLDFSAAARHPVPIGPLAADALDRAALRRAFGKSLLAAFRTLGRLLTRDNEEGLGRDVVEDALEKIDGVRSALCAMRDASIV